MDSDNARDRVATSARWFYCLTGPPTYLYDATFHHSFSMHMPNGKPESNVTPGPDRVSKEARWGSHKPYMWSYSLSWITIGTRGLGQCSTRQPTVYSYTASHRSPCIRVDSPTQFHLHQHNDHYHPDSQFNNIINIVATKHAYKE